MAGEILDHIWSSINCRPVGVVLNLKNIPSDSPPPVKGPGIMTPQNTLGGAKTREYGRGRGEFRGAPWPTLTVVNGQPRPTCANGGGAGGGASGLRRKWRVAGGAEDFMRISTTKLAPRPNWDGFRGTISWHKQYNEGEQLGVTRELKLGRTSTVLVTIQVPRSRHTKNDIGLKQPGARQKCIVYKHPASRDRSTRGKRARGDKPGGYGGSASRYVNTSPSERAEKTENPKPKRRIEHSITSSTQRQNVKVNANDPPVAHTP
ncbi:hypothetical protein JB92DRAFT_3239664 [Gautieria morchelliformis]|nr:hypothetical protein JB92DRAFT_3239664 [Gautieria morchelliformis]